MFKWMTACFKSTWCLEFIGYFWNRSETILLIRTYEWRLQVGMTPLTNTVNKHKSRIFTSCSGNSKFCWFGGLNLQEMNASSSRHNDFIALENETANYIWFLMTLNWQIQEGLTSLLEWPIQSINVS